MKSSNKGIYWRQRQKERFNKIYKVARIAAAVSFVGLAFIAVSHLVSAVTTVSGVASQGGIPSAWSAASVTQPDTITVKMTYFDQITDCDGAGSGKRMFGFGQCNDTAKNAYGDTGLQQGMMKDKLGADGLPIPAFTSYEEALAGRIKYRDTGVVAHDPVLETDPFYQWYHAVDGKSYEYVLDTTFRRQGATNAYKYGGTDIFPLDGVSSAQDWEVKKYKHNFSFTAHLSVPVRVSMTGNELFEFSGDDDVWVYLNGHLVMDLGGTHGALPGYFRINADGSIDSTSDKTTKHIPAEEVGLSEGKVVVMDFFYAERNVTGSNTLITMSNMEWPIRAESHVAADIIDNSKIQYTSSIENADPTNEIDVKKLSTYLADSISETAGFLPLQDGALQYSYTPNDLSSWQTIGISAPASSNDGFTLEEPIHLSAAGEENDTVFFRFYVQPDNNVIDYTTTVAYYTEDAHGDTGVAYDLKHTSSSTLHAIPYAYNVIFDSRGGTPVENQIIAEGGSVSRPDDPEREGYVFAGWSTARIDDTSLPYSTYDFDTIYTDFSHDIYLYAIWIEKPEEPTYFAVAFDTTGGSQIAPETVVAGSTFSRPTDPVRPGFRFLGWTLDDEPYSFETPALDNIILVATWEQIIYTVTYDLNYEQAPTMSQTVASGISAIQPTDPVREGYIFLGWTLPGSTDLYDFDEPIYSNTTIVAHWQLIIDEGDNPEEKPENPDTPENPDQPDNPGEETPESPENPDQPENPDEENPETPGQTDDTIDDTLPDMTDDTLIFIPDNYLGVLGEMIMVPNTGVLSSVSATLFGNKTIDSILLSQAYILVNLILFSISFAIMYMFRDYSDSGKFSPKNSEISAK